MYECSRCVCILDSLIMPLCVFLFFFFACIHQWECHAEDKRVYYLWCERSNVWTGGHLYHLFTLLLAGCRLFIFAGVVIPPLFRHPAVLWHTTLLCPPSLRPIFLYFTFIMLSLYFRSCLCFLKYDLPCVVGHTGMWYTSAYSEFWSWSLSTERRVKRLTFKTCLTVMLQNQLDKCSHFTMTGNLQADQTLWCRPCLLFFSMRLVQLCPQQYDNHSLCPLKWKYVNEPL